MRRLPAIALSLVLSPILLRDYFLPSCGRAYGMSLGGKLRLATRMAWNNVAVPTASNFISHLVMATTILAIPPEREGVLVECGCFKGGSTVNLSLVAAATGRRLHVFDSFAGLPPAESDGIHTVLADRTTHVYAAGDFRGTRDEVEANVGRHGALDACSFHAGFFEETLPVFTEPVVFAYVDVDLVQSEKTCLRHLWPLLRDGSYLYTDEAHHLEVAAVFFDRQFWHDEVGADPPGLVGAGSGLGLLPHPGGFRSSIGYTVKNPSVLGMRQQRELA